MDRSRQLRQAAFALLAVGAVAFAARALAKQWNEFASSGATLSFRVLPLAQSALYVLLAYVILIETWRRTVTAWGGSLPWQRAARIWFVSNLGRYIPGKVWQIGAMGVMAQDAGVSAVAATGSALVVNLVNLLAGLGVVLVTGARSLDHPRAAVVLGAALVLGLGFAPRLVHVASRVASRALGRALEVPPLPPGSVAIALAGCTLAWILYGLAFRSLVASVLGGVDGGASSYVAAFTGSYLAGYIALFAPGGIGVRELSLVSALRRLGLAAGGGAGVVVLASRIWLTVLEVLPGALFLAASALRRNPSDKSR